MVGCHFLAEHPRACLSPATALYTVVIFSLSSRDLNILWQQMWSSFSLDLSRAGWGYSCLGLEVLRDLGSCAFLVNREYKCACMCEMHGPSTKARTVKSRVKCSSLSLSYQDPEKRLTYTEHGQVVRWGRVVLSALADSGAQIQRSEDTRKIKQTSLLAWHGHFCGSPWCLSSFSLGISEKYIAMAWHPVGPELTPGF